MSPWKSLLREHGRDPLFAIYLLFVATIPLALPSLFSVRGTPVQAADLLLVVAFALWTYRWIRRQTSLAPDRLLWATAVYVLMLALSLALAPAPSLGRALKLGAYALFLCVPLLSERIVTSEARLKLAVHAWLVGLTITIAIGTLGYLGFYLDKAHVGKALVCSTYGGIPAGPYPRLCAPYRYPNLLSNYLATALPLLLALGPKLWGRWTTIVLGVLGAWVAVFTLGAGAGAVAIAAAIALVGASKFRAHPQRWLNVLIVGGAVVFSGVLTLASVATLVPEGQGHVSLGSRDLKLFDGSRPSLWKGVIGNVAAHPLTGLGYGARVSRTDDPRGFMGPDDIAKLTGPVAAHNMEAHNAWLSVLGQAGVVGLCAFLWLLYEIARGWRAHLGADSELVELRPALWGAVAGALLFHGVFGAVEEARHLWALFGLWVAHHRLARTSHGG